MAIKRKSGGTFVDVAAVKRRSGGTWITVANVYRRSGGTWIKIWPTLTIGVPGTLDASRLVASPTTSVASITFNADGTYTRLNGASGNWATPTTGGVGAGYDIRWTNVSGTLTSGTAGTWQNLSSARTYGRNRVGVGSATAVGTIEIRDASTLSVLTSCSTTLFAEVF
jgi:hypothetical protein